MVESFHFLIILTNHLLNTVRHRWPKKFFGLLRKIFLKNAYEWLLLKKRAAQITSTTVKEKYFSFLFSYSSRQINQTCNIIFSTSFKQVLKVKRAKVCFTSRYSHPKFRQTSKLKVPYHTSEFALFCSSGTHRVLVMLLNSHDTMKTHDKQSERT